MFFPHFSEIQIPRQEPKGLDLKAARARHDEFARRLVTRIIVKSLPQLSNAEEQAKSKEKRRKRESFLFEVELQKDFLKSWNFWRNFYFDAESVTIKNASQLTVVKSIKNLCRDKGMDFHILIGCTHKAYSRYNRRPSFQNCRGGAEDFYANFKDHVEGELERLEYEESARG